MRYPITAFRLCSLLLNMGKPSATGGAVRMAKKLFVLLPAYYEDREDGVPIWQLVCPFLMK